MINILFYFVILFKTMYVAMAASVKCSKIAFYYQYLIVYQIW